MGFSTHSPAELSAKLGSLASFDVASALTNASLAQAVQLGSGDKAAVAAVATGQCLMYLESSPMKLARSPPKPPPLRNPWSSLEMSMLSHKTLKSNHLPVLPNVNL